MNDLLPYRFSILDGNNQYYWIDNTGVVVTSATPKYLQYAPKGWMEETVKWNRSLTYHGLHRTYSTPYDFVEDSASILRYICLIIGTEAICKLKVEKLNDIDWTYVLYYEAEIDLSQFFSEGAFVRGNLSESGVSKYLRGNEDTTYEIPIEASDCLEILMNGIELESSFRFVPVDDNFSGGMGSASAGKMSLAYYVKDGDYSPGEGLLQPNQFPIFPFYTVGGPSQSMASYSPLDCIYHSFQYCICKYSIKQRFELWNDGSSANSCQFRVVLIIAKSNYDIINKIELYNSATVSPGNHIVVDVDFTTTSFILDKDDRVYISIEVYQSGVGAGGFYADMIWKGNPTSDIEYEHVLFVKFKLATSKVRAYRLMQVFQKLTNKLSEGNYSAQSSFLSNPSLVATSNFDNIPWQTTQTCGDAIRGLLTDASGNAVDPKIRTTFSDFFKALQCLQGVGLGYEDTKLIIEPIDFFYRTGSGDMIYDLGEVDNFSFEPAKDYLGNVLKIGYPKQDYDNLNGRDEFNSTQEYKYPIKRISKEIPFVSPYRADMYGIEYTRANLIGKKSTDSSSDNENFFISIKSTTIAPNLYELYRPSGIFNAGSLISSSTAFNIDLSPKRCLLRNGSIIRTQNHPMDSATITYQTADKNSGLGCNIGSGMIIENSDVVVSSLKPKVFLPIYVKIKTNVPVNLLALIQAKPYGYFKFSCAGYTFRMFPFEISVTPATEDVVDITLLPLPDTNISELIAAANQY